MLGWVLRVLPLLVVLAACPAPRPKPPKPLPPGGTHEMSFVRVTSLAEVPRDPPAPGTYRIHLIDVGTGLSVLVHGVLATPVMRRLDEGGFEGLTHAQRVVYCAIVFDGEVCNGGLMQFFVNSSGDHAVETLEALRELGHAEAEAALAGAMRAVGPLAREPDREMRLAGFEGRYDGLQEAFGPLESAYYAAAGRLRQAWMLYAARRAVEFRG